MAVGLDIQPASRRYIKIMRQVLVRNNEASAALEPYNGRCSTSRSISTAASSAASA
jgi:UDP-3-O-acyl-N-acetylglucosamine deacetylase